MTSQKREVVLLQALMEGAHGSRQRSGDNRHLRQIEVKAFHRALVMAHGGDGSVHSDRTDCREPALLCPGGAALAGE